MRPQKMTAGLCLMGALLAALAAFSAHVRLGSPVIERAALSYSRIPWAVGPGMLRYPVQMVRPYTSYTSKFHP